MPPATCSADIDPDILGEAAHWLVLLQSGEADQRDHARLSSWRARSAAHEAAWQRAQGVLQMFGQMPATVARDTLARLPARRSVLRLGWLALVAPAAWLSWRHGGGSAWLADQHTGTGEQKTLTLADGTRLALNTGTALDIGRRGAQTQLTLQAGEIAVTSGRPVRDDAPALVVRTEHGLLQALGAEFAVRHGGRYTSLAVFEGSVRLQAGRHADATVLAAGRQVRFDADRIGPSGPADPNARLWQEGMLLARAMRLDQLIGELARYHRGLLRCDPAVAALTVSGAFPVLDTPACLALLTRSLPVAVLRRSDYWITVGPAQAARHT